MTYSPATCYHEAAHAVAAIALGGRVRWVEVHAHRPEFVSAGFTQIRWTRCVTTLDRAIVLTAGATADARHEGRPIRWQGASAGDRRAVEKLLAGGMTLDRIETLTRQVVSTHWHSIKSVADALNKDGFLDEQDVLRLCTEATVKAGMARVRSWLDARKCQAAGTPKCQAAGTRRTQGVGLISTGSKPRNGCRPYSRFFTGFSAGVGLGAVA